MEGDYILLPAEGRRRSKTMVERSRPFWDSYEQVLMT
jgi:hypothetical protein